MLVRVDFNVPISEKDGHVSITDDTRIRASLPTIALLREKGAKVILMAHLGRPKGKAVARYSLRPIADHLHTLIHHPVAFSPEVIGAAAEVVALIGVVLGSFPAWCLLTLLPVAFLSSLLFAGFRDALAAT